MSGDGYFSYMLIDALHQKPPNTNVGAHDQHESAVYSHQQRTRTMGMHERILQ